MDGRFGKNFIFFALFFLREREDGKNEKKRTPENLKALKDLIQNDII